jgi:hypothetical protein
MKPPSELCLIAGGGGGGGGEGGGGRGPCEGGGAGGWGPRLLHFKEPIEIHVVTFQLTLLKSPPPGEAEAEAAAAAERESVAMAAAAAAAEVRVIPSLSLSLSLSLSRRLFLVLDAPKPVPDPLQPPERLYSLWVSSPLWRRAWTGRTILSISLWLVRDTGSVSAVQTRCTTTLPTQL